MSITGDVRRERLEPVLTLQLFLKDSREPECRTFALVAINTDFSPHHLGEIFRNNESKTTGPLRGPRWAISLKYRVEETIQAIGRNADARIRDSEPKHYVCVSFPSQRDLYDDFAALRELQGIIRKIKKYLTKLTRIAPKPAGNLGVELTGKL